MKHAAILDQGAEALLAAAGAPGAMANFLTGILGPLCTIDVEYAGNSRPPVSIKGESGKVETLPLFTANDTVRGQVRHGAQ